MFNIKNLATTKDAEIAIKLLNDCLKTEEGRREYDRFLMESNNNKLSKFVLYLNPICNKVSCVAGVATRDDVEEVFVDAYIYMVIDSNNRIVILNNKEV